MSEREGVTKYTLQFTPAPALPWAGLAELDAWRTVLFRLGLIGEDSHRYDGVGFGNVSRRLDHERFLISGTQTGRWERLGAQHYARVTGVMPEHNRIIAEGPVAPSSEALTHAAVYAAAPAVNWVFHVHSPEIWRAAHRLALPATPAGVSYGTPDMAAAVRLLFERGMDACAGVFVMAGHEDGVIGYGASAGDAGTRLVSTLALALEVPSGAVQQIAINRK